MRFVLPFAVGATLLLAVPAALATAAGAEQPTLFDVSNSTDSTNSTNDLEIPDFQLLGHFDIRGNDAEPRSCNMSIWWCANACRDEVDCVAFTYVFEGNMTGNSCCYLKDTIPPKLTAFRPGDEGASYGLISTEPDAVDASPENYDSVYEYLVAVGNEQPPSNMDAVTMLSIAMRTLYPPETRQSSYKTAYELLTSTSALYTVFVPNNMAFNKFAEELNATVTALFVNRNQQNLKWLITSLVSQNELSGEVFAVDPDAMAPGQSVVVYNVLADRLTVSKDMGGVTTVTSDAFTATVVGRTLKVGNANVVTLDGVPTSEFRASTFDAEPRVSRRDNAQCVNVTAGLSCCLPGSYGADGVEPCLACPPGTYQTEPMKDECRPCRPNSFSTGGYTMRCTLCPTGQVTDDIGATGCRPR